MALQTFSRPIGHKFLHANRQLIAAMWTSLSRQATVIWRPLSVKRCDTTLGSHYHHYHHNISSVLIQRRP